MGAMKKREIEAQKVLNDIYQCIAHTLSVIGVKADIEAIVENYPYFYMKYEPYERLVLSKIEPVYDEANKRMVFTHSDIIVDLCYSYSDNTKTMTSKKISVYKKLFPFMKFTKMEYCYWLSDAHESSILYKMLPSRKNIIDAILKEI